jgi:hypothetical protein
MFSLRPGRTVVYLLILATIGSGCCTKLGYFPEQVKDTNSGRPPTYPQVRTWALQVADGYDTRHTTNRYSLYAGALTAAAGAGAMAGLAAFAPGAGAIIGIPIGTTFLSGVLAIFNNEPKAVIYDRGARAVSDLVTLSDCRMQARQTGEILTSGCAPPDCTTGGAGPAVCQQNGCYDAEEAVCLHRDVQTVMRRVSEYITFLDPKNVTDTLKAVAASAEAAKAEAAHASSRAEALKKTVADVDKQQKNAAAQAAAAAAGSDDQKKWQAKAEALKTELDKLTTERDSAVEDAKKKEEAASAGKESLLTTTLKATLVDPTDLQTVVTTCERPPSCIRLANTVTEPNDAPQ